MAQSICTARQGSTASPANIRTFWLAFIVVLASTSAPLTLSTSRSAGAYLDSLFADDAATQLSLAKNFQKSSRTVVVFVAFNRTQLINSSLPALMRAEGLEGVDVIISQDGGCNNTLDIPKRDGVNSLYIRHRENLGPGQHHYFIKRFVFDMMGWENLIIIEDDNVVHPQAIKMLAEMIDMSVDDPEVGLVSSTDLDNSILVNDAKFGAAVLRIDAAIGHLWVYGMHISRYSAVKAQLTEYVNVIKGRDYLHKDLPPLRDDLIRLLAAQGLPKNIPLSQDSFVIHTLAQKGYRRRLSTLLRLFVPIGYEGLHSKQDPASFFSRFGKVMHDGKFNGKPFDVSRDPVLLGQLKRDSMVRLNLLYQHYLGRPIDEPRSIALTQRLVLGTMNAVEMVRDIHVSAEHRRRMNSMLGRQDKPDRSDSGWRRLMCCAEKS